MSREPENGLASVSPGKKPKGKRTKTRALLSILGAYFVLVIVINAGSDPFWASPVSQFLRQLHELPEFSRGDPVTRTMAGELILDRWYSYARWTYAARISGTEDDWVVTFYPAPSPAQRLWLALFRWEFSPPHEFRVDPAHLGPRNPPY